MIMKHSFLFFYFEYTANEFWFTLYFVYMLLTNVKHVKYK